MDLFITTVVNGTVPLPTGEYGSKSFDIAGFKVMEMKRCCNKERISW
jgi:hypothetical protein